MRIIWLVFGVLLSALLVTKWFGSRPATTPQPQLRPVVVPVAERPPQPASSRADSIVQFALAQRGTPYVYAGTQPATGFDCSGFIRYVFGHFHLDIPHSTALLIDVGQPVPRAQARPGDIVVFTGTAAASTTPGHAGIIISAPGEVPLRFVHASSARRESGVKVSQVEDTDYERRFMQVRRVLGPGGSGQAMAAARPQPAPARPVAAVPTLPPVATETVLPLPPPMRVVPLRAARRPVVAHAIKPTPPKKSTKSKRPFKPATHKAVPGHRPGAKAKHKAKAPRPTARKPTGKRRRK
ncbi:MAG: C40 family peptidase [Janthinobacterium lividum]